MATPMLIDMTRETFVYLCNHLDALIEDSEGKLDADYYSEQQKEKYREEALKARTALQELYGKCEEGDKKDGSLCF